MVDSEKTVIERPKASPGQREVNAYLIVLSGRSIGKMYKLDIGGHLIGRSIDAEIQLEDDGVSRRHARLSRASDGIVHIEDLNSTNGTWINGKRIHAHELADGDRIQVGSVTILKFSYQDSLEERFQQQLYESVTRDALTSAYNKRFFEEQLDKAFSHAQRHRVPLSLMILDVDHFKQVNDTRGHQCGDKVLAQLGETLIGAVRNEDVFCRVGGEEFAIILRDCPARHALMMGERIRAIIERTKFEYESETLPVTVSIGVATLDRERHARPDALYEEADRALYEAKHNGRNRVCGRDS